MVTQARHRKSPRQARFVSFVEAMLGFERIQKSGIVFTLDTLLCAASILIAFSLRVGALSFPLRPLVIFAAVAVPLFIPIFYFGGAYSTIFRFSGSRTILQLARASFVYSLPLIAIFILMPVPNVPRTLAVLHPMIFFGLTATSRVLMRYLVMDVFMPEKFAGGVTRVLVYGAGSLGQQLAVSLRHEPSFVLIGFVDDDPRLDRQRIDGVPIFHSDRLKSVCRDRDVDTILLALPNVTRKRRRELVEMLRNLELHVRTLPNMAELAGGRVSVSDLQEIQIEDLLMRDIVAPNEILLGRTIVGKTVIVTGAGGSIGSELCRQIMSIGARRLILFERSEYMLYMIEQELRALAANLSGPVDIIPALGSVTDRARIEWVMDHYRPHTVFHAAAYKHVPLVEANPIEGIANNVAGTYETVRASERSGVSDFILISTDKAVRPTNVMGATKRTAEQVVQAFADQSAGARYSIVRFGNVLGSSGSVVPLFRQQIEDGGPITLTHRDVTRFFMTIPEAAQLVIQAGGMARGGEVFVLDMGNPVRIYDLARSMVELSGLSVLDADNPDGDIEIVEFGLRPGEKLYEELLIGEQPQPTHHPRIMMAHEGFAKLETLLPLLAELGHTRERSRAIEILKTIVPEFDHQRDNALAS